MRGYGSISRLENICLSAALSVFVAATPAHAQSAESAAAEALFQEGRDLLREGKTAEACPKLAESNRLDPATGTLIALAMCHEQEGKLASAWAEFFDAASRAKGEGRPDREEGSRQRAEAIQPRLSKLRIEVPDSVAVVAGVEVKRDGVAVGRAAWNVALPIDGGRHVIDVTAPHKRPFHATIDVKLERDAVNVRVPPLADAGGAGAAAPSTAVASSTKDSSKAWGGLEWVGVGTATAGVVAWGVGGYFLATALGEKKDSEADCDGNVCGDEGFAKQEDMVKHGNMATSFAIGGAVLVGIGATLFFVGRGSGDEAPKTATVGVSLGAQPGGAVASVRGAF